MSDYKGPAYRDPAHRPIKNRRFNRVNGQNDWRKSSYEKQNRQLSNQEPEEYQLPEKVRQLETLEYLSPVVDAVKMDRHIEVKLNQQAVTKSDYQVAFDQGKRKEWDPSVAQSRLSQETGKIEGATQKDNRPYQSTGSSKRGKAWLNRPQLEGKKTVKFESESQSESVQANRDLDEIPGEVASQGLHQENSGKSPTLEWKTRDSQVDREKLTDSNPKAQGNDFRTLNSLDQDPSQTVKKPTPATEKSLAFSHIRQVALRMSKAKESFLIFEESK